MNEFFINGRFLSQSTTGVQRYAYEITNAIGKELAQNGSNIRGRIVTPVLEHDKALPSSLDEVLARPFAGHLWEQTALPLKAHDLLVNLCNSGPLAKSNQITCIHGANSFVSSGSYSRKFRISQKILLNGMGRRSVHVTTVSRASADLLHELNIVPKDKQIIVIPNGHEHALAWKPEKSEIFEKFPLKRPFVLLIGSRSPHKNVGLILSQARALDEAGIDIAVAGGSFGIFKDENKEQDFGNVIRLGYVSDDDLAALLSKALCFVFPSLIEGFGLPLVEAMAVGCPIVSSNTASMPEVCGEAAILLDPTRGDLWVDAIKTLRDDEALRQKLVADGKVQMKRFSWTESARAYLRLIQSASSSS